MRFSTAAIDMGLHAMTGGNFCWKFLDICEVKLFVTAWTLNHKIKQSRSPKALMTNKNIVSDGIYGRLPLS